MEVSSAQLVMALPLHAVTDMYGEGGIRQRFALETAHFPDPARARLDDALVLAADLHRHDRRAPGTVLGHLLRTALRILCYYEVDDDDVLVATLLQYVIEDHPADVVARCGGDPQAPAAPTLRGQAGGPGDEEPPPAGSAPGLVLEMLARRFSPRVADLVQAVTPPAPPPGRNRFEHYRGHVAEALDAHPWARVIKVSDFTDNAVDLIHGPPSRQPGLATEYRPLIPVFRAFVSRVDTPLADHVKEHIFRHLDGTERQLAAILAATALGTA